MSLNSGIEEQQVKRNGERIYQVRGKVNDNHDVDVV